jgi:signal peptidase I
MKFQSPTEDQSIEYPHLRRSKTVEGAVNTLDWLLVALILALVFRAFAVEAFQIPTGSMAETLKGAHWHLRCLRCGKSYDFGGDSEVLLRPECPMCKMIQPPGAVGVLANGDRIFVNKCIYQFSEPKRWDVVVFKNPPNPQENYIKRLIGLPGEQIEIREGDIYINGQIARKPRKVQDQLWMCVYHQDYPPAEISRFEAEDIEEQGSALSARKGAFENEGSSRWDLLSEAPSAMLLNEEDPMEHRLVFMSPHSDTFRTTYAYNDRYANMNKPICSDLMIRFWIEPQTEAGMAAALLEKDGIRYIGRFDFFGQLVLERQTEEGNRQTLRKLSFRPDLARGGIWFEFANVDHRLVIRCGDYRLSYDLNPDDRRNPLQDLDRHNPEVKILGSGKVRLRHVGLYRDIYYLSNDSLRARPDKPFQLRPDEFFVCGDNSPNSFDSRQWPATGVGNNQKQYRPGVVPRDFLMGKAFFVYWSDAFRPRESMMPVIPNLEKLRVICGGSDEMY